MFSSRGAWAAKTAQPNALKHPALPAPGGTNGGEIVSPLTACPPIV